MAERLLINCTYGEDDPERATVPYIVASTAAASGQDAVVVCTADGVWTGVAGRQERIAQEGMPTVTELYEQLIAAGGRVWLCSACTNLRDITEDDLAEGASIVGAAQIVEAVASGGRSVTLT